MVVNGLAAAALAITVATSGRPNRLRWAAIAALELSAAGDSTGAFLPKLGLFAAAHVAYIIGFWSYRHRADDRVVFLNVVAVPAAFVIAYGHLFMLAPILAYAILILTMTWLATGVSRLAGIGAVVFMASDLMVGWNAFHAHPGWLDMVALGLYVTAQSLLAAAIIRAPEPAHPRDCEVAA